MKTKLVQIAEEIGLACSKTLEIQESSDPETILLEEGLDLLVLFRSIHDHAVRSLVAQFVAEVALKAASSLNGRVKC